MVVSLERWQGKVAVVTGSSSGIGAAISEKLVEAGVIVVGLARRKERLDELAVKLKDKAGKFHPIRTDVSKEEDLLRAFEWVEANLGAVHVLVNSAGLRKPTNLVEGSTEMWREIIDVNVLGLCVATREAVRSMRKHHVDGHVIHVNSLAGHRVLWFAESSVYPASKHAVTALTETLRQELNAIGSKIKVTSISPGLVDNEFRQVSGVAEIDGGAAIQSEDVAHATVYVLGTPPHVQVHELIIRPVGGKY
ncbi:farnesol dehydrogenase-like [Photinus pyralis]|uniref:farnesol dehydrogenase-like n=1 Tax=Photinus pyralis TaxID=7054 RepID=UPI0012673E47|nr:farnesol dehydrogenase-like [Photinus pyralis]